MLFLCKKLENVLLIQSFSAIYHRLTDLHGCFPVRFIFHGNKVKFAGGFPFNYSRGSWCPWNRIDLQNMNAVNWLLNEKAIPPHSRRAGSVLPLFKSCRVQESCKCALPLSCPFINSCIEQHAKEFLAHFSLKRSCCLFQGIPCSILSQ
jgi:hypothetical protein